MDDRHGPVAITHALWNPAVPSLILGRVKRMFVLGLDVFVYVFVWHLRYSRNPSVEPCVCVIYFHPLNLTVTHNLQLFVEFSQQEYKK